MDNISKYEELIEEYRNNRIQLKNMIIEIEDLKNEIKEVLPKKIDARYKHIIDEKIKILTSFYDSILKMRQEINKSLVGEMDLIKKYLSDSEASDINDDIENDKLIKLANKIKNMA